MQKVISKDGTPIAYEKVGKGPALILVDGALCSRDFGPMRKIAELLSNNFTVYFYDRRGRNQSGDTKPYLAEREVEDIEALVKEANGPVYLAGSSSGAALALKAAASGLNVIKLALFEPPYLKGAGGHEPPADAQAQLQKRVDEGNRGAAVKYFMHDMVGLPSIMTAIFPITPVWKRLKAVAHTLPYDAAILGDFSIPLQIAKSIHIPTLVGAGTKSPKPMQDTMKRVVEAIPGSKLYMLKGQTHNASPKSLATMFTEFFN